MRGFSLVRTCLKGAILQRGQADANCQTIMRPNRPPTVGALPFQVSVRQQLLSSRTSGSRRRGALLNQGHHCGALEQQV